MVGPHGIYAFFSSQSGLAIGDTVRGDWLAAGYSRADTFYMTRER